MQREAILHIGPMKTGTTSIQAWLRKNREALAGYGIHFPRAFGAANMSKLSQVADAVADGEAMDGALAERWERLTDELEALPATVRSVVISGEMLGQHLRRPRQVAALKRALDPYASSYRIIVYLRRQDEISVSLYNTRVRNRSTPDSAILSDPMDYAALLETWSAAFGTAAMMPRLFDRSDLAGGDIIVDFAAALGLAPGAIDTRARVKNQSFNPAAQSFLSALYDRVSDTRGTKRLLDEDAYGRMIHTLSRNFVGPGHTPGRAEAVAFVAKMDPSNEIVRKDWFPARARLFSDDFSKYPADRADPPSPEDVLEVALVVASELLAGQRKRDASLDDNDDAVRERHRSAQDDVAPSSELWETEDDHPEGDDMKTPGEKKMKGDKVKGEKRKDKADKPPKLENKVVSKTARTLWRMANQDKLEGIGFAERKAQWTEQKEPYVDQAKKLLRSLRKDGVEFTFVKDEAGDEDADLDNPLPTDDETRKSPVEG